MDTPLLTSQSELEAQEKLAADVLHGNMDIDTAERIADLPDALARHVACERLSIDLAEQLRAELDFQTSVIAARRDADQRSNLVFMDNYEMFAENEALVRQTTSREEASTVIRGMIENMPPINAADATFEGNPSDLVKLARAAKERFAATSHDLFRGKDEIAFDFGYVDQHGDWNAPHELDGRVKQAISPDEFARECPGLLVSITPHDHDHPKIRYDFWRASSRPGDREAIVVIRKRPFADVTIDVDGEPVCVEVFRKSWFLVSAAPDDNEELNRHIGNAEHGRSVSHANSEIAKYVHATLDDSTDPGPSRHEQTLVLPCTMTYVAQVRNPNHTGSEVELDS